MPVQIWECEAVHDPLDMMAGSALAQVVELIITQYEWFFQNDASLPWDHLLPTTPLGLYQPGRPTATEDRPATMERQKGKGKKAPPPPSSATVTSSPPASPQTPASHRSKSLEGGRPKTATQPCSPQPSHSQPVPQPASHPSTKEQQASHPHQARGDHQGCQGQGEYTALRALDYHSLVIVIIFYMYLRTIVIYWHCIHAE